MSAIKEVCRAMPMNDARRDMERGSGFWAKDVQSFSKGRASGAENLEYSRCPEWELIGANGGTKSDGRNVPRRSRICNSDDI